MGEFTSSGERIIDTVPEIEAAEVDEAGGDVPAQDNWSGRLTAFRALRHRNFRLFFVGQLISLIGTWMQMVAQAWLVLKLTNSSMMLGIVSFAGFMPIVLVALFAGVVVDHVDRRRLIIGAQTLLMLSAFVLAALTWAGVVKVEYVIALAALNGLVSSFDMPGRQAFVVEMVGREDLPNAISMNSMIFNGARMIGPAIAGMSLAVIGIAGCFLLNGVSYLAVIWSLLEMELPRRERREFGATMMLQVRLGLAYVWRHRPTLWLLVLVAINMGIGMQYSVLIPVFARDLLHVGAHGYGFLMAAQGLGAVISAIVMNMRSTAPKTLRQNLVFGIFCMAICSRRASACRLDVALAAHADVHRRRPDESHGDDQHSAADVRDRRTARPRHEHLHAVVHRHRADRQPRGRLSSASISVRAPQCCSARSFSLMCGFILLTKLKLIAHAQAEIEQTTVRG